MNRFILNLIELSTDCESRIDFISEKIATDFYEISKLDEYKIYQYIQSEYLYEISIEELEQNKINFIKLNREKKALFGLFKKNVTDILIEPNEGFYYPHSYGYYLYIFTKHKIEKIEFENWITKKFSRYGLDDSFYDINSEFTDLINEDDYFVVTNHDLQEHFGLCGNANNIKQVINKYTKLNLKEFTIQNYKRK